MDLLSLLCVFPTPNIEKTASFYSERMGFRRVDYLEVAEPHICLYRGATEIVLTHSNGQEVIPNHKLYGYGEDAYFITENQEMLQEEFVSNGVKIIRPLAVTDYNNKEFTVEDIDGRWIAFGRKQD